MTCLGGLRELRFKPRESFGRRFDICGSIPERGFGDTQSSSERLTGLDGLCELCFTSRESLGRRIGVGRALSLSLFQSQHRVVQLLLQRVA